LVEFNKGIGVKPKTNNRGEIIAKGKPYTTREGKSQREIYIPNIQEISEELDRIASTNDLLLARR